MPGWAAAPGIAVSVRVAARCGGGLAGIWAVAEVAGAAAVLLALKMDRGGGGAAGGSAGAACEAPEWAAIFWATATTAARCNAAFFSGSVSGATDLPVSGADDSSDFFADLAFEVRIVDDAVEFCCFDAQLLRQIRKAATAQVEKTACMVSSNWVAGGVSPATGAVAVSGPLAGAGLDVAFALKIDFFAGPAGGGTGGLAWLGAWVDLAVVADWPLSAVCCSEADKSFTVEIHRSRSSS